MSSVSGLDERAGGSGATRVFPVNGGGSFGGVPCSLLEGKKQHVCGFCLYEGKNTDDDDSLAGEERKCLITKLRQFIQQNTGRMNLSTICRMCEDIVLATSASVDPSEWTAELIYEHFTMNDGESDKLLWAERISGVARLINSLEGELGRKRKTMDANPEEEDSVVGGEGKQAVSVNFSTANMYIKSVDCWIKLQRLKPKT